MNALPTPRDVDGAPFRVETEAMRLLAAGVAPEAIAVRWPAVGARRRHAGRELREVTFLVSDAPADADAIVHLNGITDGHRTDIRPALLRRIPGTPHRALGYLLPDGLVASYRYVVDTELPVDAGRTREGWLRVHRLGRRDPRNPDGIPDPLGETSSVLRMPGARVHPAWEPDTPAVTEGALTALRTASGRELGLWRPRAASAGLLMLFDGERWAGLGLPDALERRVGPAYDVVTVPAGTPEQRSAVLPHPARIGAVLANDVLPAVARAGVPVRRETTIVAGQSYGGLAAAAVVATRPELAATAIVQSGSFHFRADQPPRPPAGQRGELLDALAGHPVPGRHLVQVGTEEGDMLAGARTFHATAQAGGAHAELDVYAGGHDYAWWRTGLFDALDRLSGTTVADVPE